MKKNKGILLFFKNKIVILIILLIIVIISIISNISNNNTASFGNVIFNTGTIISSTENSVPATITYTTPDHKPSYSSTTIFYKFPLLYLFRAPSPVNLNDFSITDGLTGQYYSAFKRPELGILSNRAFGVPGLDNTNSTTQDFNTIPLPLETNGPYPKNIIDINKYNVVVLSPDNADAGIPLNTEVKIDISNAISEYTAVMKADEQYILGISLQSFDEYNNDGTRKYFDFSYIPYIFNQSSLTLGPEDPGHSGAFITTWNIAAGQQLIFPIIINRVSNHIGSAYPAFSTLKYDFLIDWGDNTVPQKITNPLDYIRHTYTTQGQYTITVIGQIDAFSFGDAISYYTYNFMISGNIPSVINKDKIIASAASLLTVEQWGSFKPFGYTYENYRKENGNIYYYMPGMFRNCVKLIKVGVPDLSNMNGRYDSMFYNCNSLNDPDIANWVIVNMPADFNAKYVASFLPGRHDSAVNCWYAMFCNCTSFNVNLDLWNNTFRPQRGDSLSYMFNGCINFNNGKSLSTPAGSIISSWNACFVNIPDGAISNGTTHSVWLWGMFAGTKITAKISNPSNLEWTTLSCFNIESSSLKTPSNLPAYQEYYNAFARCNVRAWQILSTSDIDITTPPQAK